MFGYHGWLGGTSGWVKLTTSCADTSQGGCVSFEMFRISLDFNFWAGHLVLIICNISSQGGINDCTDELNIISEKMLSWWKMEDTSSGPSVLGPSGPLRTISYKNDFLPQMDKVGFCRGASKQNINSSLKWPKRVPNDQKHLGWPFWSLLEPFGPLWNVDKPAMFGHFSF